MSDAQPRFFVLSGPDLGRSFDLEAGAVFGRSPECAAPLRAHSISRRHARLEREGAGWALVDLGSRNGLFEDGERVERIALTDGLVFRLGDVELRFRLEEALPAAPPAPERAPEAEPPPRPRPAEPELRFHEAGGAAPKDPAPALEPDEIVLEDVGEPAPAPKPAARPAPTPKPAPSLRPPGAPPRPSAPPPGERARGGVELRDVGRPVLQYSAVPARRGFALSDLAQQPLWLRLLVGLFVVALFVALFLFAFRGAQFVRGKAQGGPASVEETGE